MSDDSKKDNGRFFCCNNCCNSCDIIHVRRCGRWMLCLYIDLYSETCVYRRRYLHPGI